MQSEKTESAPAEPTPEQRYTHLCALIGERHYLAQKLAAEVTELSKQIDELKAKSAAPEGA